MPRALRIEFEGAVYHVMNRGDRREPIFREDADRKRFLEMLGEAGTKTDGRVHALCLMGNHFHLVVETPKGNLAAGMKWFLGTPTARCNRRHTLCGHLFSGRYQALVVDAAAPGYFRTVCEYVPLNPNSEVGVARRRGERTPLACRFRRLAENLVPLTFPRGEES